MKHAEYSANVRKLVFVMAFKKRRKQMLVLECSIPRHVFRQHSGRKTTQFKSLLSSHTNTRVNSELRAAPLLRKVKANT